MRRRSRHSCPLLMIDIGLPILLGGKMKRVAINAGTRMPALLEPSILRAQVGRCQFFGSFLVLYIGCARCLGDQSQEANEWGSTT
jgi:hypothetical protein